MRKSWLHNPVFWPVWPYAVREALISSQLPTVEWSTGNPIKNPVTESYIGGLPYCPDPALYPRNENGHPLIFLAQLNLNQFSHLTLLPNRGILQFFLDPGYCQFDTNDSLRGQAAVQVIFNEDWPLDNHPGIMDFSFLPKATPEHPMIHGGCCSRSIPTKTSVVSGATGAPHISSSVKRI